MRSTRRLPILGLVVMLGLLAAGDLWPVAVPEAVAAASRTSVQATGLSAVAEVSHTGGWVLGGAGSPGTAIPVLLDRSTGQRTEMPWPEPPVTTYSDVEFVRDNPVLRLTTDWTNAEGWQRLGTFLTNTSTGARVRVDTDSAGNALVPAWKGNVRDEPDPNDNPGIWVAAASVTRNGTLAAFCANYDTPDSFTLYVKNLSTGTLTKRPEACAAGGPVGSGRDLVVTAPEISYDGRVLHLRGTLLTDSVNPHAAYYADTLVFPRSDKASRKVKGQGSMTRDGKTLLMRIGVHKVGTRDRTGGKVGAYSIATRTTTRLPGRYTIYGTDALLFSAFDQATWRGRYVVYGNRAAVIDRRTGKTTNIGRIMRRHGYPPDRVNTESSWFTGLVISGDGKLIFARSDDQYMAVDWR